MQILLKKVHISVCFGDNILLCMCDMELVVSALHRVDVTLLPHRKDCHHQGCAMEI